MAIKFPYRYVCIEGNIGAGKTSFCELMQKEYNCKLILEEFDDNPFLPYFYNEPERFALTVELFFMTERHKQLEKTLLNQDLFYDFTIADYFFSKTLLFARNNLNNEEFKLFNRLYRVMAQTFPKPDLIVYFHRDVDILLENIRKRGREYEKAITADYLMSIQNTYFEYLRSIVSFPVLIMDVNTLDFVSNEKHFNELNYLVARTYRPGVHRMSLSLF